jgi:uncharacterized repeat protein (TIGR03803 family)
MAWFLLHLSIVKPILLGECRMLRSSIVSCAGLFSCVLVLHVPAAQAASEGVVYAFQDNFTNGAYPSAGLSAVNGTDYGTTVAGGTYGQGSVYAINLQTGAETVVHSFCSQIGKQDCADGAYPYAGLIEVKGMLFGTTLDGGAYDGGTVYSLDPSTGTETVLHSFGSSGDGNGPYGGLIAIRGELYGTTAAGGANGDYGTVFSLDPKTGAETVLYSFCGQSNCTDGVAPQSGLIDVRGTLYGTTIYGGSSAGVCNTWGCGTIFALDPATGAETVLYSFCSQSGCVDGMNPYAGVLNVKGKLYGDTEYGGTYNNGVVFSFDPATGTETALHSFQGNGADGVIPSAGLLELKDTIYGTTTAGGAYGGGIVFSLDRKTGAETVLHSFGGASDGRSPEAGVLSINGTLYGTTEYGGAYSYGTVFSLTR